MKLTMTKTSVLFVKETAIKGKTFECETFTRFALISFSLFLLLINHHGYVIQLTKK